MKILVVTHSNAVIGGVETYLSEVLPLLFHAGFQVGLATELETTFGPRLRAPDERLTWRLTSATGADNLLKAWEPNVVLQNGVSSPSIEKALASKVPAVLFAHGYYGTCVGGMKRFANPSLQVCHRRFGPACLALYFPRRCGGRNPVTAVRQFALQRARLRLLPRYQLVLVSSEAMREEYLRHGVSKDRLKVVPLFVGATAVAEGKTPAPRRTRRGPILMFSRLVPEKGAKELIEAASQAQAVLGWSLELVFAGSGAYASLERLARRCKVSTRFVGWVSKETRLQLLATAALVAVPSIFPEPFGVVGIEAGAEGVPAVGFAGGGISEWLIDGVTGMSAPGERPCVSLLAAAIVRALDHDDRYEALCVGAREGAARFSASRHMLSLAEALRTAASSGHNPGMV